MVKKKTHLSTSKSDNNNKTMPKIGKYELGKTLGSGYSSKVKFATDIETGEW